MRKLRVVTSFLALTLACGLAQAQFGGGGGGAQGPKISSTMVKVFGEHKAFSARLEFEVPDQQGGGTMTMPGKMAFKGDRSRFEMNMAEMKGAKMPPDAVAQMKQMGMDQMLFINRQDKKANYVIYPALQSYVEMALQDKDVVQDESKLTAETTELGNETVDGHPCIKNKMVVTDEKGEKHEFTAWNATDLKKFPVRIQSKDGSTLITMNFKDIKLEAPEASLFEVDASFTKYTDMMSMMQQVMMKKMGGGGFQMPPPRR